MQNITVYLKINQWLKNLLIFVPAFFAAVPFTNRLIFDLLLSFLFFSLLCSTVYIINDLKDNETDKLHPSKRKGRIAMSDLNKKQEWKRLVLIGIIAMLGLFCISFYTGLIGVVYLTNNLVYTYYLKNLPVLDVLSLLGGFLIRLLLGSELSKVVLSFWLIVLVCFIGTALILVKRRSDVFIYRDNKIVLRKTVIFYNRLKLGLIIKFLLYSSVIFYGIYLQHVHYAFSARKFAILMTLPISFYSVQIFLKEMNRNPHQDPLKLMFQSKMNVAFTFVVVLIFAYHLYAVK